MNCLIWHNSYVKNLNQSKVIKTMSSIIRYLDPIQANTLCSSVNLANFGINERRVLVGFALGLAIGGSLPVIGSNVSTAENTFDIQHKVGVEDCSSYVNEYLIHDRITVVDVARSYYTTRCVMAGDMINSFVNDCVGVFPHRFLFSKARMDFYKDHMDEINCFVKMFAELIQQKRASDESYAAKQLANGE